MSAQARPNPRILLRLLAFLKPYKLRLLLAAIALVVAASGVLLLGQGLRLVVDKGFASGDSQWLNWALVGTLGVVAVMSLASACRFYLVSWIGERLAADLRLEVFRHLLTLEPEYFHRNGAGEIQSRLTADTSVLQSLFGSSLSMALRNLLTLIGAVILLLVTSPWLTLMVLLGIPLTVVPVIWFGRRVRKLSRSSQDQVAELGSYAGEALQGIETLQAFNHEAEDQKHYGQRVEEAFSVARSRVFQRSLLTGFAMLVVFTAVGIILWQGGQDVLAGRMSPGQLTAFVFYALIAAGAVATLAEVAGEVQRASGAAERLLELLGAQPKIAAPEKPLAWPSAVRGEVAFEQVTFAYPSRPEQPAIEDFSTEIRPGERVALVGPSGAGKSSVLKLLLRFYDPDAGRLCLDGINLKDLSPAAVRSTMALVAQEPVLFTGTAEDNIRYGRPEATDEEVQQAAQEAQALGFIQALPEGMQTWLGPGGVQLSGGQRQRLAIARALLCDPRVLLLDEATSALDAASENLVQQALDRLMEGRTSLVIAHRLATVIAADRILVMDQGRLVAEGTHQELLKSSELYRNLAELQLQA
ncbi:ABC transporter transmembrane domain-containing protein [Marinospirillum sp.]|uniref:ABC transporter transmembrane domain-containing protein n=1 Tax=Marinospirillum sp. TaxID=2183934 RepID=UPI00286FF23D|nr:ABC transporter transmembrane domain-containing protein [Marinospirillum sp.]MDR9467703.1 ABC transporter transmembrane domain-containing protein [Marinospirillum sp.]